MPICGAFLNYNHINFEFYILETLPGKIYWKDLALREDYWFKKINPSYNLAPILDFFKKS